MATKSKITLLAGERVVMSSDADTLTLTNMRVRLDSEASGRSRLVAMVLDAVASCGLVTRSHPFLLLIGALAVVGALTQQGNNQLALFAIGAILVVVYFATRSAVLTITSVGGSEIVVPIRGMGRNQIVEFIDALEKEKLEFLAHRTSFAKVTGGAAV